MNYSLKRSGGQKTTNDKISQKTSLKPIVISVSSGKGGVGKTLTTVNFAMAARRIGLRVLIFDGDLGLANVDVVLGLQGRYNIRDVLDGQVKIEDVIIEGPMGINVISSGSGIASLQQLTYVQKQILSDELASLENKYDLILIDTGAGISDNVIHLNMSADKVVVVTTPEPHAMTDAYALIKVLKENGGTDRVGLLVNMARTEKEANGVAQRISDVALKFMDIDIDYLGYIPHDPQVSRSILIRKAASEESAHTISGQAWNKVTRSILASHQESFDQSDTNFWQNLLWNSPEKSEPLRAGLL